MGKIPMLWLFLLSFTLFLSIVTSHGEGQGEYDYVEGSKKGPEHWGELKKEWETCKTGQIQSPIDLNNPTHQIVPISETWAKLYRPFPSRLNNTSRGRNMMVELMGTDNNKLKINGTNYILQQCHWHSPSEHTINGRRFGAELHMVHKSKDKKLAVVSILYKIGSPNPILSQLTKKTMSVGVKAEKAVAGIVYPTLMKMGEKGYYRYMGSLTTPPCTQGVIWTINRQIATISQEQVTLWLNAVEYNAEQNARPVQPVNGRVVELYTSDLWM